MFPEQKLVYERFTGTTDRKEFQEMVYQLWKEPDYHKDINVIMDFRQSAMDYKPEDIRNLCQFFMDEPDATDGLGAFLVSTPKETALTELFELNIKEHNNVGVFSTWGAAAAFLGVTIDDPFAEEN
ncbi:MAG: hypothetical protein LAT58_09110 [Opitutales bacterium]|nr:hypothetical protein [Opitutales bacterium]